MLFSETSYSRRQLWLLALLILNILASILHYTDNLIHFDTYPEPDWFTPYLTDSIWWLMTPCGIAGFWFYRQQTFRLAYLGLYSYALLSQLTLGHYAIAPIWTLSLKMNALILLESWVAIPLVIFALCSQFGWREGQQAKVSDS